MHLFTNKKTPRAPHWAFCALALFAFLFALAPPNIQAEALTVRYLEGSVHGFLVLRAEDGKIIATGDLIQTVHGDRVVSKLAFHFKDGSLDDETAVFTQRGSFRLLSDHHIQKGPSFPRPLDLSFTVATGEVIARYREKGEDKVDKEHMDLPEDLVNGIIIDVLKNLEAMPGETKLSYLVFTSKPRLVKLSVSHQGEDSFSIAGVPHTANRLLVKVELGGLTGLIAPLIGKQPSDFKVWVGGGEAPAFVRSEGQMYEGGPIWTIEMSNPVWARDNHSSR